MERVPWLPIVIALCAAAGGRAQAPLDVDFFGTDFRPPPGDETEFRGDHVRAVAPSGGSSVRNLAQEFAQSLVFHDGRRLCGRLEGITKDEILWRRADAGEVLRIARADVRRVLLIPPQNAVEEEAAAMPGERGAATVMLAGANWLNGWVTSPDGKSLTVNVAAGDTAATTPIVIPRDQARWLSFALHPSLMAGLDASPMGLEGWISGNQPHVENKDGGLIVRDAEWLGHEIGPCHRFEVDLEVPPEGEDGLELSILTASALQERQESPADSESFTDSGDAVFRFGRKKLQWRSSGNADFKTATILDAAQGKAEPVRYRVLFDGLDEHIIVFRNGTKLLDSQLRARGAVRPPHGPPAPGVPAPAMPVLPEDEMGSMALGLERGPRGKKVPLQLRSLSLLPWDGSLPKGDPGNQDQLFTGKQPLFLGHLEAVRAKDLIFDGRKLSVTPETYVRFSEAPPASVATDALVSLGARGELRLGDLRVSKGRARGAALFAPALELPVDSLKSIAFPPRAGAEAVGDRLVFKNGDELPGMLVAARAGAPLRWRLATGQEVDFQTSRLAGVRFPSESQIRPAAMIELRTGERLRGAIANFEGREVRWSHALLGELSIDRAQVWRLDPVIRASLPECSQDPQGWLRQLDEMKRTSDEVKQLFDNLSLYAARQAWLAFDGHFILNMPEAPSVTTVQGPAREIDAKLDLFELRVDAASPTLDMCELTVVFFGPGGALVALNLQDEGVSLTAFSPKDQNNVQPREFKIPPRGGESVNQSRIRAFVNRRAGTIDFCFNDHFIGRSGDSAASRFPGIGRSVALQATASDRIPLVLSQVVVLPWSGVLPAVTAAEPAIVLTNGDVTNGSPTALADGRWKLESDVGPLDLPMEKVQAFEFGGEMQPVAAAARLRLVDGSTLLVDRFEWKNGQWTAHHALFGDLRIPASAVGELIYNPAPVRPATIENPGKAATKDNPPAKAILR